MQGHDLKYMDIVKKNTYAPMINSLYPFLKCIICNDGALEKILSDHSMCIIKENGTWF